MSDEDGEQLWFCEHCNAETLHNCTFSTHERDASNDYFECLVCGWYYSGYNGKYNEP